MVCARGALLPAPCYLYEVQGAGLGLQDTGCGNRSPRALYGVVCVVDGPCVFRFFTCKACALNVTYRCTRVRLRALSFAFAIRRTVRTGSGDRRLSILYRMHVSSFARRNGRLGAKRCPDGTAGDVGALLGVDPKAAVSKSAGLFASVERTIALRNPLAHRKAVNPLLPA